jgi:hypothetical protein
MIHRMNTINDLRNWVDNATSGWVEREDNDIDRITEVIRRGNCPSWGEDWSAYLNSDFIGDLLEHWGESEEGKVKVQLLHCASIPGSRWCNPMGWHPTNKVDGAEYEDFTWWDSSDEEAAGLLWLGDVNAHGANEVAMVNLTDLRVASCGDMRILGNVTLS